MKVSGLNGFWYIKMETLLRLVFDCQMDVLLTMCPRIPIFKSLPNEKLLDWSELKELQKTIENSRKHTGERRNCCYEQFLLSPL